MLMQSAHGYVNILPALPAVWEKTGTVTGMKAMGNFTVDFNWTDGKCQKATIVSNAGAELRVRCTRGAMELAKAMVTVDGVEVAVKADEHGIVTIPCAKGSTVVIDFTTESGIAAVDAENAAGAIYDVAGRKVNGVSAGHVYIQNGVKKLNK
jgi:alpha-L-fucosidase 2